MSAELITLPRAAALLGLTRVTAWREAKRSGSLCGVAVVMVNGRAYVRRDLIEAVGTSQAS